VTRYVLRRLAHAALLLFGVSVLTFLFAALAPGNYFDEMKLNPQISPTAIAALRAQYGMDRPLPVRYTRWLGALLRGNLGFSFAYNSQVWPLLRMRAAHTLLLTTMAMLLAWGLAVPLGIWSAEREGGWPDHALALVWGLLLLIPDLVLALGLLMFAVHTGFFPAGGMAEVGAESLPWAARARDFALHLVLPVAALGLSTSPILVRHVRAAFLDVLDSPFLRAARGHGIPRRRLLYRHALRAAANPLLSLFGFSLGTLLSSSLIIEVVMSWPGLGPFLLEAILARDQYVVIGGVLLSTVFLVGGNLFADLLLYWADPRIRARRANA
jgi:peptide/nickel transport system permease protein